MPSKRSSILGFRWCWATPAGLARRAVCTRLATGLGDLGPTGTLWLGQTIILRRTIDLEDAVEPDMRATTTGGGLDQKDAVEIGDISAYSPSVRGRRPPGVSSWITRRCLKSRSSTRYVTLDPSGISRSTRSVTEGDDVRAGRQQSLWMTLVTGSNGDPLRRFLYTVLSGQGLLCGSSRTSFAGLPFRAISVKPSSERIWAGIDDFNRHNLAD